MQDNLIGEKRRKPFLDSLIDYLNDDQIMSDEEVKDQVDTIMFEVRGFCFSSQLFYFQVFNDYKFNYF